MAKRKINIASLVTRADYARLKKVSRRTISEAVNDGRIKIVRIGIGNAYEFIDYEAHKHIEFKPDHRRPQTI